MILGMPSANMMLSQMLVAEVLEVERKDHRASTADGRRKHMPVLLMVAQGRHELFKARYLRFGKSVRDLPLEQVNEALRPVHFGQVRSFHFLQNARRPVRDKQPRALRKTQQKIAHAPVGRHAGIDENLEIGSHSSPL